MANEPLIIRYRCSMANGAPMPGHIIMGNGPRTRRAYRVRSIERARRQPGLGTTTWHISVESMPALAGRAEIEAGCPFWGIKWDSRKACRRTGKRRSDDAMKEAANV